MIFTWNIHDAFGALVLLMLVAAFISVMLYALLCGIVRSIRRGVINMVPKKGKGKDGC